MKSFNVVVILILYISVAYNSFIHAQTNGNITYTLHKEQNPTADQLDAYSKIKSAIDSAIGYYNKYTSITKNLNVYYNTGVQTADASFNGTIRFGSSRSYMVVHTAMHEIAHTVGIGTTTDYSNLIKNKVFTGPHATAKLKEILGPDSLLKGDNMHFWPFGLNYASEVRSQQDLINHCRIVNEIYKDMFGVEEFFKTCYLRSKPDGRYIIASGNTLILSDSKDSSSLVKIIALNSENVFRLEFGDKVLEIPNESRNPGISAGLYNWNGGSHQRTIFEFNQSKNITRIKMSHSGLYLRADGNKIIQDQPSVSIENQYWELIGDIVRPLTINHDFKFSGQKMWITNNRLIFDPPISINNTVKINITDLHGRSIKTESFSGKQKFVLPVNHLAKGIYLATVYLNNQILSSRFMIE